MLLYNGQNANGHGDFLSLSLVDGGRLRMRYDLGSGAAELTTRERAEPGVWHKARASRSGPKGTLQLNEGPVVRGEAEGHLTELNLGLPMYIGGFR